MQNGGDHVDARCWADVGWTWRTSLYHGEKTRKQIWEQVYALKKKSAFLKKKVYLLIWKLFIPWFVGQGFWERVDHYKLAIESCVFHKTIELNIIEKGWKSLKSVLELCWNRRRNTDDGKTSLDRLKIFQ